MKKIFCSLFTGLFLILYYCFLINIHEIDFRAIFFIISLYPLIRIVIDFIIIIISFINDKYSRKMVFTLSNKRIDMEISWDKRLLGVYKWLSINFFILTIGLLFYEFV